MSTPPEWRKHAAATLRREQRKSVLLGWLHELGCDGEDCHCPEILPVIGPQEDVVDIR